MADVDLHQLNSALRGLNMEIQNVNSKVEAVNQEILKTEKNVNIIQTDLQQLVQEFLDFVKVSENRYNMSLAETRIIKLTQELDRKFGHYDEVRRMTTGILQATDLGIIRGETMTSLTEEITLKAPGYWLAPSLLALTAWINDQPEIARKALDAAIKRDDEKTSLLFALICRRADRYEASLKWLRRYIGNQEPDKLDRKFIIVLDSYVNGLLGTDSEGEVYGKLAEWLDHVVDETDFVSKQRKLWGDAFEAMKRPIDSSEWPYSVKYSNTWPMMEKALEYVELHGKFHGMLTDIFETPVNTDPLKTKLDEILNDLVNNYDMEEMPIREDLRLNNLIVEFDGDVDRAKLVMESEKTAFEPNKDFAGLLTEVSMNPELSGCSASLQKYAISLCKDWIADAYRDTCAKNRANIPNYIEINVDTFNSVTQDGSDEEKVLAEFDTLINNETKEALSHVKLSLFDNFCLGGGGVIAAVGAVMLTTGVDALLGLVAMVAGVGLVLRWASKFTRMKKAKARLTSEFEKKRESGKEIIRALIAEIVDFRDLVKKKDGESQNVERFLEGIHPDQFVETLAESVRKIDTNRPVEEVRIVEEASE